MLDFQKLVRSGSVRWRRLHASMCTADETGVEVHAGVPSGLKRWQGPSCSELVLRSQYHFRVSSI